MVASAMPADRFWQIMGGPGPSGEPFEDDEEHLAKRYPNLWRRFGAEPLG